MVEQRKTMHREIVEQVGERKGKFLNAQIPYTTDVERMGLGEATRGLLQAAFKGYSGVSGIVGGIANTWTIDESRAVDSFAVNKNPPGILSGGWCLYY